MTMVSSGFNFRLRIFHMHTRAVAQETDTADLMLEGFRWAIGHSVCWNQLQDFEAEFV